MTAVSAVAGYLGPQGTQRDVGCRPYGQHLSAIGRSFKAGLSLAERLDLLAPASKRFNWFNLVD